MRASLLIVSLFLALPAAAQQGTGTIQFCWAVGALDDTVYYAEALERDDRSQNFGELLEVTGIDHNGITCVRSAIAAHPLIKHSILRDWRDAELDVVNTTYMSDLDY
ncbi:hypothetical protein [Bradyrhizobium sp. LHD-71]|uniref:hypothetical protein n=1 Tax=Bradyrhizobium sp. LHD-71 TaxID=3072141 RepID=UPI00280F4C82|nr:hypothetical protein [Bradyrhizobium sp. LHD-71]MDQ8730560.1 hypothetical protein [Bradyrhizobium sp. LHD-71]